MDRYKILKVPISKEKAVFYYYKCYDAQQQHNNQSGGQPKLVTLPTDKTL